MLPPQGTAIQRHSFPMKTRTRLAYGITDIFPAYADFVHATDWDIQAQNGSPHSCVVLTFIHWFLTNLTVKGLRRLPLGSPLKTNTETRRQFRRMDNGPHVQYGCRQLRANALRSSSNSPLTKTIIGWCRPTQTKQKKLIKTRLWGPFPKTL